MCACVCVCVCMHAYVCACVHACVCVSDTFFLCIRESSCAVLFQYRMLTDVCCVAELKSRRVQCV